MTRASFGGRALRDRALRAMAFCALAAVASFGARAADVASPTTVDITKFMFMPMEVTVAPGTSVRWVNHDDTPHTVSSQDKAKLFASKALDTDDHFDFVFTKEGDYTYVCSVHPFMTGIVHVRKQ
jgi:plastocyanin